MADKKIVPIRKAKGASDGVDLKHPLQPLVLVEGTLRFKENHAVNALYEMVKEKTGQDPWHIIYGCPEVNKDDLRQFAQLIGYSHSGSGTLSYMDDETWEAALAVRDRGISELEARNRYLERRHAKMVKKLGALATHVFNVDIDDLEPR
ncbi:hypothetical protein D3C85_440900 [compost metagenome]